MKSRTFFLTLFFLFFAVCLQAQAAIVINEIMYDVPDSDDGREWIEISNTGTEAVDMTGWKLFENNMNHSLSVAQGSFIVPGQGFAIIADTPQKFLLDNPYVAQSVFDSAFSLSNAGELIALKDNHGGVIDAVLYSASLGGSGDGNTLSLVTNGWEARLASPGIANETTEEPVPELLPQSGDLPDDSENQPESQLPLDDGQELPPPADDTDAVVVSPPQATDSRVSINEIMYDVPGSDTGHEWIEIINKGSYAVDLTDWKLFEQDTDHRISLVQGTSTLAADAIAIIADNVELFLADHPGFSGTLFDSAFSLLNAGETIGIKDNALLLQDQYMYDVSLGAAGDGNTLQFFDAEWKASPATPGFANALVLTDTIANDMPSEEIPLPLIAPVSFSEIAWMGVPGNQYGEWLELYNDADASVDLNGWKLYKDGGETLVFTLATSIESRGYIVIERMTDSHPDPLPDIDNESGLFGAGGLGNGGEFLVLKDQFGRIVQSADFSSGWPSGDNETKETMQYVAGTWIEGDPTPGEAYYVGSLARGTEELKSDIAPVLADTLNERTVEQAKQPIKPNVQNADDALPLLIDVSLVARDAYAFLQIKNTSGVAADLSGMRILGIQGSFVMPDHTFLAGNGSIVIVHKHARYAEIQRAYFDEAHQIIIE